MNKTSDEMLREMVVREINRHIGAPYVYGGQGRPVDSGIDCSGLVIRCLYAAGLNLGTDMNAASLREYFRGCEIKRNQARPGDLYFYGKPVQHVCVCYKVWDVEKNYRMIVGANGGSSSTKTITAAWNTGAFVKVERDIYWLSKLNCVINPFLKKD